MLLLIFNSTENGWNQQIMWDKCKDYEETIVLIKTNFNRTIGAYNSNKWEETKIWKVS